MLTAAISVSPVAAALMPVPVAFSSLPVPFPVPFSIFIPIALAFPPLPVLLIMSIRYLVVAGRWPAAIVWR